MKNNSLDSLVSYKKGFATTKIIAIISVLAAFIFSGFIYFSAEKKIEKSRNQVVLYDSQGNVTNGEMVEMNQEIRKYEYNDHVQDAIILLNQYDEGTIDENLEKASYYFNDVFESILKTFDDKRIKQQFQEKNIYTTVTVHSDSVYIDYNQTPYKGQVSYVQNYKMPGNNKVNKLYNIIEFTLEDFNRSNENPHGVKIISWQLIHSELLK